MSAGFDELTQAGDIAGMETVVVELGVVGFQGLLPSGVRAIFYKLL